MAYGMVDAKDKKGTLTERVCYQLEDATLRRFYNPGDHLDEMALSLKLGCSRPPIRELLASWWPSVC